MAYVKILTNRNVISLEKYLFKGRDSDDPIELNGCNEGFVSNQFIATQAHFGRKHNFNAIHVIQSFKGEEATKLNPEEYTRLGKKLIEEYFPGHEFCVVSHTDEKNFHNHIMVNPVNSETGKRINDKMHVLYDLQEISDKLCLEKGLSIIEEQSKVTWKKTPKNVRDQKSRGGFSWVLDLKEKANFARTIATSFDEYAGVLNQFGIEVRVENKEISYGYPGRKPKRGGKYGLSLKYTKEGLIEQFKENYPRLKEAGLKTKPIDEINFRDHWKFHRKSEEKFVPEYRYKDLVIPKDLIRSIQSIDLKEYGERNGHSFFVDDEGKTRLKDKPHLLIEDNRWLNEKTKTRGGAFEFINYCHNESWLETLSRFDTTGKVQRIKNVVENKTPSFKAFYVPKPYREGKAIKKIDIEGILFESSKILSALSKEGRVKAGLSGRVKFVSQEHPNSSLTVHQLKNGWVTRKSNGINGTFFSKIKNKKDPLIIFEDPIAFLSSGKLLDRILNDRKPVNIIVPLKPLNDFLNERKKSIKGHSKIRLVRSKENLSWGPEGKEQSVTNDQRTEWEKALGIKYASIEDLFKELILGRSI